MRYIECGLGDNLFGGLLERKRSGIIKPNKETLLVIILLAVFAVAFLFNKIDVVISSESDGYFHALGAYFIYDIIKWWITDPTFSYKSIEAFVFNYELQYKFFGGIGFYQPFQSFFVAFVALFSGKSHITFYIVTIIETLVTLIYARRLYTLLYGNRKWFPILAMILIAINPAVFNFAASFSLEPGVMMFSVMTIFYFIRFLRENRSSDMILTGVFFGFALLTKTPAIIILPILLISIVLERRVRQLTSNYRSVLLALLALIIVISPWLIMEYLFSTMGISKIGERMSAGSMTFDLPVLSRIENLNLTIFYSFGSYLLLPFFIYKFLKSKLRTGEITILSFAIIYALFYNLIPNVQPRYLTALVPFVIILSVRGVEVFHDNIKNRTSIIAILISMLLLTSAVVTINYTASEKRFHSATDMFAAAVYVSDNLEERTTVMATFSRMQSVAFNVLDDENVVIVRAPFMAEGGTEELDIMLDSAGYIKRPHRPEWERFNLIHPPIEWVIVHQRYDGLEPDYKLKDEIEKRDDFALVKTIEGSWEDNRIFIYRRTE